MSGRGDRGLRWIQVLPEVVAINKLVHSPAVIVVHAKGNNLCGVWVSEYANSQAN